MCIFKSMCKTSLNKILIKAQHKSTSEIEEELSISLFIGILLYLFEIGFDKYWSHNLMATFSVVFSHLWRLYST